MNKDRSPSITNSESILRKNEIVDEEEDEEDEGQTHKKSMRWSTRFRCYAAYACCVMSYSDLQINCEVLNRHGTIALIPLILFRIIIGTPAVIIQILLGRYIMTDLSKSWSMHIVATGVLICEIGTTCYDIIHSLTASGFVLQYLMLSFSMPWETCRKDWASDSCYENLHFQTFFVKCLEEHSREHCKNLNWRLSGVEYWQYVTEATNKVTSVFFFLMCLFVECIAIFAVVIKGVQSAEKSLSLFVVIPLVLTPIVTLIVCSTSEFSLAVKRIFNLDLHVLLELNIWAASYNTTLFTLGIGRLPLSFVSSCTNFDDDIFKEVLVICLIDIIFSLLFTMPTSVVMDVMQKSNIKKSHCSDALWFFISLSELMTMLPTPKHLLASIYYLLLVLMSLGCLTISTLAVVETLIGFAPERLSRFYMTLSVCFVCLSFSMSLYFCEFDFTIFSDKSIGSILFLYLFTLELIYGFQTFMDDFYFMMGFPVPFFLKFAWIISLPASAVMIILSLIVYRDCSSKIITYLFIGLPFLIYLFTASIRMAIGYHNKTITQPLQVFATNPDWGPADPVFKKSRALFDPRAVTKEFMYRQELQEKIILKPPDISNQGIVNNT